MDTGPSPLGSKGPGRTAKLQAVTFYRLQLMIVAQSVEASCFIASIFCFEQNLPHYSDRCLLMDFVQGCKVGRQLLLSVGLQQLMLRQETVSNVYMRPLTRGQPGDD